MDFCRLETVCHNASGVPINQPCDCDVFCPKCHFFKPNVHLNLCGAKENFLLKCPHGSGDSNLEIKPPESELEKLYHRLKLEVNGPQGTPLWQKAINFGKAIAASAAHGFPIASEEQVKQRLEICKTCDKFIKSEDPNRGTCSICGCRINPVPGFLNKLGHANASCPIGKWGSV